jgi:hypothetical protein
MNNHFEPPFSFLPSIKQETALLLILAYEWLMIGFVTIKIFHIIAYDISSELFTTLSMLGMLFMLVLVLNSSPKPDLSKKRMRIEIILIAFSFACYVVVSSFEYIV